ncbi:hypothetical protein J2S14_002689 [Lederbergia wuyishanensis]|uniref:Uncharacterized protein n=1 Tax=Lederbergia wuyishanensis TaxID=1347903 RepID=A0ABU0D633_9BACI|nr:hypothetical protein [Lederbergia wuyishanensis]
MTLVKFSLSAVFFFLYFKLIQLTVNTIGIEVHSAFNLVFLIIIIPVLIAISIISSQKLIVFIRES